MPLSAFAAHCACVCTAPLKHTLHKELKTHPGSSATESGVAVPVFILSIQSHAVSLEH